MRPIDFIKSKQEGVILKDYSLKDMEWFMIEYNKHLVLEANTNDNVPVEITDFIHRLRFAEHEQIRYDASDLFNRYCMKQN
jgi:hypothetical protein